MNSHRALVATLAIASSGDDIVFVLSLRSRIAQTTLLADASPEGYIAFRALGFTRLTKSTLLKLVESAELSRQSVYSWAASRSVLAEPDILIFSLVLGLICR